MRQRISTQWWLIGVAGFIIGALLFAERSARSQTAAPDSVRWDYNTVTVEANALQAKLGELANDRWEVFSIVRGDLSIEQGADNQTRLKTVTFQVTGRRRIAQKQSR